MIWADFRAARSGDIGIGAFGKDTAVVGAVMVAVLGALAADGGTLKASAASALSSLAPLQLFWCRARLL